MGLNEKEIVVFSHSCPVCEHKTSEVYLKERVYVETYSRWNTSYSLQREERGLQPFSRFEKDGMVFLVCPKCGVVLSGKICEKVVRSGG